MAHRPPKQMQMLKPPRDGLGLGNLTQKGVSVDEFDHEGYEIILPPITWTILSDRASDILGDVTEQQFADDSELAEKLIEEFKDSDSYREWEDTYRPMMLYYWPCFIHGENVERVAALMEEFAPACSLLAINGDALRELIGEDYAIVLTGGGMNLSDHLALAYICAGSVPPIELLQAIRGVISKGKADRVAPALKRAYQQARGWLLSQAADMLRTQKEIYTGKRQGLGL